MGVGHFSCGLESRLCTNEKKIIIVVTIFLVSQPPVIYVYWSSVAPPTGNYRHCLKTAGGIVKAQRF